MYPSKVPAVEGCIKTLQESLREAKSSLEAAQQRQNTTLIKSVERQIFALAMKFC